MSTENYPNSDPDRHFTLDAADQLAQIRAKKAKMLEANEVDNPANAERKSASDDGERKDYTIEDVCNDGEDYPITEADDQVNDESGEDNSGQPKSPLQ